MATATKAKRIELTEEQRKFLGSQRGGWCSLPKGNDPLYVEQLVHAGYLHYDGIWANAHHWCLTGKARAALKRGRPQAKMDGSKQAAGGRKVGKKFSANKRKPDFAKGSLRWLFCMRFRELVKGKPSEEVAQMLGISGDLARKWIGGSRAPDIDDLPAVAKAFGLDDWTDLFRPKNS